MELPSRYISYDADTWSRFRGDTALDLTADDLAGLKSLGDHIDLDEVERVYLPVSRLMSQHVETFRGLFDRRRNFTGFQGARTPFVIGIAGSVAVGKSTTARLIQSLLQHWPSRPKVDLITTDGFLHPNAVLNARDLMKRKGFPESYDRKRMIRFLSDVKGGKPEVKAPVYSHFVYDVVDGDHVIVDQPDILIFEGLNVLQTPQLGQGKGPTPVASDYFDFSIYVDAPADSIEAWYIERFMRLRETAFTDPASFFHKYSTYSDDEAVQTAKGLWTEINLVNLKENIRPTRGRAGLILHKGQDHLVEDVSLRRL